ncbi:unnamed protein product [Phytophthora lilii]|uniref:Unnamed protein product n=1 Tax=Phytophthora lilii TaxID=2077276 RepID=A0A9W6XB33_9STRA|nr:unnamed protein product [Phytophthora lilii]
MSPRTEAPTEVPSSGSSTDAPTMTEVPTTFTPQTDAPASISTSGSADETPAPTTATPTPTTKRPVPTTSAPTPEPIPWSPPPIPSDPTTTSPTPSESSGSGSSMSSAGFSDSRSSSRSSGSSKSSSNSSDDVTHSPPPVTSTPQTAAPTTKPTTTAPPTESSSSSKSHSGSGKKISSSGSASIASGSTSSSSSSDTTWSPPPVTSAPKPTTASSTTAPATTAPNTSSSSSGAAASSGSSESSQPGSNSAASEEMSTDDSTPSPAPVTRAPAAAKESTEAPDTGNDISQTAQASDSSSSDETTPSPAPVTRSPSSKSMTMPPSPASSDSMGTVIPADTSDIDNSAAEAVTKQTDSGSSDEADKNTLDDNNMILLGDTGSTIMYTDGSKITTFEKYNRGDGDLETLKDYSGSYDPIYVGGANRSNLPPGASISLSSTAQEVQNALLYASYALGIVSTVLLMFFHLLALQRPPWLGGSSDTDSQDGGNGRTSMGWLTPNVWELAVVVGYIQHVSSISMLELTKAPQIVLDFTDSFSFANLHISSVTTTAVSEASRRLQLVILTGIVAYSDRIGIDEDEALLTAFWFFLAVVAIIVVLFALATGFAFYRYSMSADTWSAFYPTSLRSSFAMSVVGLGVALWVLSVFPLISMSSYELVMELRYRVGIGLAVALFSLWAVVVGGLCYAFVSVRSIPINDAFRFKHYAVWGTLYGDAKMAFRYFFVVTVGCQILLGVLTGAVSGIPTQLVALMVTHLLFIVVALIIRPFAARWVLGVVVGLRVVAIVNLMCSFAFLTSSELSTHWRGILAQGFVIFNSIVFFLFFARYVAMFVIALKRWSGFTRRESFIHSQQSYEIEQQTGSRADQTPIFMTYDVREHRQYNDGGRFIASGAGFAPSRGPSSGYSSGYSSSDRYASTPTYHSGHSSGQRYAPTPSGSSGYFSDSRAHGQSRGAPHFYH